MTIENVTVIGCGVLGSQIAFHSAYHGFNVRIFDNNVTILETANEGFRKLGDIYRKDFGANQTKIDAAFGRIRFGKDLSVATQHADLCIESITEDLALKKELFRALSKVAPEKTIFATNTSTLLPSVLAADTGRPEKFLALHFANNIWRNNLAEIMAHSETYPNVVDLVHEFARAINMVPVRIQKEQPGYLLNSMLMPFLNASLTLLANGVAHHEDIDKTWQTATGAPSGPFRILDMVGLQTAYAIARMRGEAGNADSQRVATFLQEHYISQGKLGAASGEGFYKYGGS